MDRLVCIRIQDELIQIMHVHHLLIDAYFAYPHTQILIR